jgi:hypothetical protein
MFNSITWQGYWVSLALLTLAYYLIVYLFFYRGDFKISIPPRRDSNCPDLSTPSPVVQPPSFGVQEKEVIDPVNTNPEGVVYALMDELVAYFEEAKRAKVIKPEFLYAIRRLLLKYPSIKSTPYQASVSNVIISEAQHICSVHISEAEMAGVWLEV